MIGSLASPKDSVMKGSCLCGGIVYEIDPPFEKFYYCHCSRCRKITGSAHAANLFVGPKQFRWVKGEELVERFEHSEAKYFATGFCNKCGSSMPWLVQGGATMIVPAGTLDDDPDFTPQKNIFWDSRACWFKETDDIEKHAERPRSSK